MFAILIPHLAPNPFPKSKLVIVLKRRFFSVASFLVDGMVSLISNVIFQKQDYGFSLNAIRLKWTTR